MRFVNRRMVWATLRRLRYADKEHFTTKLKFGKTAHSLVLRFASKTPAQAASDRIMEEHRGGA